MINARFLRWQQASFQGLGKLMAALTHRIGPEKGVIHIATAAVNNAIWDMYARKRQKPLWKLIADMSPVRLIFSFTSFNIR